MPEQDLCVRALLHPLLDGKRHEVAALSRETVVGQRGRRLVDYPVQQLHHLKPPVRRVGEDAGAELEESDAEAPDVAVPHVLQPRYPLGGHVGGGADPGVGGVQRVGKLSRHAKVRELHLPPRVEEDVRGFDVAVNQSPLPVKIHQCRQQLSAQPANHVLWGRSYASHDIPERAQVHVLGDNNHGILLVVVVRPIELHHVGMAGRVQFLKLAEHVRTVLGGEVGSGNNLHSDDGSRLNVLSLRHNPA
mmetsp:Transcript_63714/g.132675  ORF Transcript_63714/g.132675 Transcript_63714/m.132675 type:complete len:247 (-) Transcript_63714:292-1032(-)